MAITAVAVAVANGAAVGTSPPSATINGGDVRGTITQGSGTSPTTGTLATLTLGGSYNGADTIVPPIVQILPRNAATAALGLYVASVANGRTVTVGCTNAPTASQSAGTYAWDYIVTL